MPSMATPKVLAVLPMLPVMLPVIQMLTLRVAISMKIALRIAMAQLTIAIMLVTAMIQPQQQLRMSSQELALVTMTVSAEVFASLLNRCPKSALKCAHDVSTH